MTNVSAAPPTQGTSNDRKRPARREYIAKHLAIPQTFITTEMMAAMKSTYNLEPSGGLLEVPFDQFVEEQGKTAAAVWEDTCYVYIMQRETKDAAEWHLSIVRSLWGLTNEDSGYVFRTLRKMHPNVNPAWRQIALFLYDQTRPCAVMNDFANRLREARRAFGYTQKALAEMTGVPAIYISSIETGHRWVSGKRLGTLASALGVDTPLVYPQGRYRIDRTLAPR